MTAIIIMFSFKSYTNYHGQRQNNIYKVVDTDSVSVPIKFLQYDKFISTIVHLAVCL